MILKLKMSNKNIAIAAITVVAAIFYYLFNITGLRLFLGSVIIYFIPVHLILGRFKLDTLEKLIFSFFISLGIFPLLTYYFGKLTTFRIGMIISFILLGVIALILRKKDIKKFFSKEPKNTNTN